MYFMQGPSPPQVFDPVSLLLVKAIEIPVGIVAAKLAGGLVTDLVLHKVNPAWGRRFALTMFYAARTQAELKSEERKSRASSTGLSKITLK